MMGKYDVNDPDLLALPSFDNSKGHETENNAAYVDSFHIFKSDVKRTQFWHALIFMDHF